MSYFSFLLILLPNGGINYLHVSNVDRSLVRFSTLPFFPSWERVSQLSQFHNFRGGERALIKLHLNFTILFFLNDEWFDVSLLSSFIHPFLFCSLFTWYLRSFTTVEEQRSNKVPHLCLSPMLAHDVGGIILLFYMEESNDLSLDRFSYPVVQ